MHLGFVYGFGLWFAGIGSFVFHSFNTGYTLFLDLSGANVLLANIAFFSFLPLLNLQLNFWLLTVVRLLGCIVGFAVAMVVSIQYWLKCIQNSQLIIQLGSESISHEILIPLAVILAFCEQVLHISLRMAPALCGCSYTLFSENQIAWEIRRPSFGFLAIVVGLIGKSAKEHRLALNAFALYRNDFPGVCRRSSL